jgi:hypothetical protein
MLQTNIPTLPQLVKTFLLLLFKVFSDYYRNSHRLAQFKARQSFALWCFELVWLIAASCSLHLSLRYSFVNFVCVSFVSTQRWELYMPHLHLQGQFQPLFGFDPS